MRVIVFGSTGMVGQGVLRECLLDPGVTEVITVVRKSSGKAEPKLREIVHANFEDFSDLNVDADACFWCLGISSTGLDEAAYTKITHDYAIAAARVLAKPTCTLVFVSGVGADGNAMWARVKKRTEDDLAAMPWKAAFVFRPGVIRALHGIRSRTRLYNALYPLIWPVMQVMRLVAPSHITTTERIGRAMLHCARDGYPSKILYAKDMNAASRPSES